MRSSSSRPPLSAWLIVVLLGSALVACAAPESPDARGAPAVANASGEPGASGATGTPTAGAAGDVTCPDATVNELRRSIENGPLFAALSELSPLVGCTMQEKGERVVLDYAFAGGSSLHVERDAGIEFTLQELRFATPQKLNARDILTRAERAAFGESGCGIDWESGEVTDAETPGAMSETAYRGDTCNCQARVRVDRDGRIVALTLRSAC